MREFNHLKYIYILLIILLFSCEENKEQNLYTYSCDAESITEDRKLFLSKENSTYFFNRADLRSDSIALSGNYSLKLTPKEKWGFEIKIKKIKPEYICIVLVWVYSENKEGNCWLTIQNKENNIYRNSRDVIEKNDMGWEKIEIIYRVPKNFKGEEHEKEYGAS